MIKSKSLQAWESWNEGRTLNLIDPILKRVVSRRDVLIRCFHIGLLCVQEKVADRPTMASVILMLSSDSFVLPLPSRPPYLLYALRYGGTRNIKAGTRYSLL